MFRVHNPKVVGSNPTPATKEIKGVSLDLFFLFLLCSEEWGFYILTNLPNAKTMTMAATPTMRAAKSPT
jgi:hypothetical protein